MDKVDWQCVPEKSLHLIPAWLAGPFLVQDPSLLLE